ncbi:MAG: anion permease [Rhodospirillales bacterium]|nr:anion permease [Rhodospirillales bacterium]
MAKPSTIVFLAAALIAAALLFIPAPAGMNPGLMRAAAVMVLAIGLWSTSVVPAYYGSLIFMFACMVLAVAPAKVVFSGFAAGAIWLVFGGIVVGAGVKKVGLDVRLVRLFLRHFPTSYLPIIYGIFWASASLAFVIPSAAGRVALLVPIMLALSERLGFKPQSKGQAGVILASTMGTMVSAFGILPANVPNSGLYGAMESVYATHIAYGEYFILNYPVLGGAALILYPLIIWTLFRDKPEPVTTEEEIKPWAAEDVRLLVILMAALILWITDTLHGVAPSWVALGAGLICVMPRFGVLPSKALAEDINYGPILFVAGIIGLGAVATDSGIGSFIADQMLAVVTLKPGQDFWNFYMISGIGAAVGLVTTMPAQPAIMVPMAQSIADASGWSLMSVVMSSVPTWMMMPFPYQGPPVVLAIALANLRIGWVIKLLLAYSTVGVVVILPLHYQWGRFLGYFGAG